MRRRNQSVYNPSSVGAGAQVAYQRDAIQARSIYYDKEFKDKEEGITMFGLLYLRYLSDHL